MEHYIITHVQFVRENTLAAVRNLTAHELFTMPTGFRNNIAWHLGHIYVIQEKFAFQLTNEEPFYPEHFLHYFGTGSSPSDWPADFLPTLEELTSLLTQQISRIEQILMPQLDKAIDSYTTSKGLTLTSVQELLSFCLYHEGMHFNSINTLKRLLS